MLGQWALGRALVWGWMGRRDFGLLVVVAEEDWVGAVVAVDVVGGCEVPDKVAWMFLLAMRVLGFALALVLLGEIYTRVWEE